jgi:hypothetical protein
MSLMRVPFTLVGRGITGLTLLAFVVATTGCGGVTLPPTQNGGGDGSDGLFGVIVNTDTTKDLLGGLRKSSGEAVYAFGRFNADGTVADVTSVVYQNADGQVARLFLESGRPVRAVGFDGATVEITYAEVSAQRLAGTATYTPADGSAATVTNFDIDLEVTAAEVAATVQDLTGLQISTDSPPSGADVPSGQGAAAKTAGGAVGVKSHLITAVVVPIAIAVTGFAIVLAVSQIARAFVAVGNAMVVVFLLPFIVMGNLMRSAVGQPPITIQYGAANVNINIPPPR